jgi:hypothetical protein
MLACPLAQAVVDHGVEALIGCGVPFGASTPFH